MTTVSMLFNSHLSDIQTGLLTRLDVHNRCNFIKWIMLTHKDLRAEIDSSAEWIKFTQSKFFVAEKG
mgnify:CR=1 FL=1